MKFYFVADLHYTNGRSEADCATQDLVHRLKNIVTPDDVVVLLGDYGNGLPAIEACLDLFRDMPTRVAGIAGNHDLWCGHDEEPGDSLWRHSYLQNLFVDRGIHPLEGSSLIIGTTALVGAMGWYDYSFGDLPGVGHEDYARKVYPGYEQWMWNDVNYVRFPEKRGGPLTDQHITTWQRARLDRSLSLLPSSVERIVVGMHHLPTKRLLHWPRWLVPKHWRFCNTFLGSECFAQHFAQDPRVEHVVAGHVHMRRSTCIGKTHYWTIGSDYDHKEIMVLDGDRVAWHSFG